MILVYYEIWGENKSRLKQNKTPLIKTPRANHCPLPHEVV